MGEYFSSKFFIAKVAQELYYKKRTDSDGDTYEGGSRDKKKKYKEDNKSIIISQNGQEKPDLTLFFDSIKFSKFVLLLNPLFETLLCGYTPFNLCKRSRE